MRRGGGGSIEVFVFSWGKNDFAAVNRNVNCVPCRVMCSLPSSRNICTHRQGDAVCKTYIYISERQ